MLVGFYNKDNGALEENTALYLQKAVFVPLTPPEDAPAGFLQRAYAEFAESFLAQPLLLLENSTVSLAGQIDVDALSQAVVDVYGTSTQKPRPSSEELIYLLAHVVDLQKQMHEKSQGSLLYLKAVYTQLSFLSNNIRLRFAGSSKADDVKPAQDKYLEAHIRSLVDKEEITRLLKRFTASQTNSMEQNYASLLAGYAITLTLFLKNLSFTLLYNASDLLKNDCNNAVQSAFSSPKPKRSEQVGNYYVVPGLDFRMFKTIVTTAIQMLYERDSRRKFLPTDHWHMTSYFDMTQFVPAVVTEEQRQHDLRHAGNAEEDEDMDVDDEDSEDGMEDHSYSASSRAFARTSRYALLERMRRQREKSQRDRLLATIGPKLEILRNMPYVLPFEARVRIFREFVHLDKLRRRDGFPDPDAWRAHMMDRHGGWGENSPARSVVARHSARIRRDSIFESAMNQFWELGEGLKEPIQITFIDDFGNEEAGIDGGGVTKEFLTCALMQVLSPEEELFESNTENAIYPSPTKFDQARVSLQKHGLVEGSAEWDEQMADLMKHYEFIGRMIGKCLYEGILIDFVFAGFFLLKWALSATDSVYRANLNDLREMDEELYQGMLTLKNYDGDVADFGTDFTLQDQVSRKGDRVLTETRKLIPNGDKIPVTNENRLLYISYVARHRLMVQPHLVTKAFLRGLGTIIDPVWLRMFNQNELQRLVGGDSSEIDVEDLRRNTIYGGLYVIGDDHEEHPTVKLFWDVVQSLPDDDRRLLLKYVTSTPRAPLLGFSQLSPKFSIRDAGVDEARLPSTSTCVNLLKLPRYSTKETLREKLLYAIRSNARFDLS
ncbi:ubiquitin-protein ligase (E3) [Sporothrix bragantina]|uniref:HECT-type E3 ubiquitin transferase n=1 Tax=Sporothrix bragantina TaxID=671064 RepID=A0ABP0BA97_9PEZI